MPGENTDPSYGMTKLDSFIANLSRADLEVLARGALYAANTLGRHWPTGGMLMPDMADQLWELREDITSHIPVGMPAAREEDRTRWEANWWRDLFGMPLLDEDGAEIITDDEEAHRG